MRFTQKGGLSAAVGIRSRKDPAACLPYLICSWYGCRKRGFAYGKIPLISSITSAAECLAAAVSKVG